MTEGLVMGEGSYAAPDVRVLTYGDGDILYAGKYCSIAHRVTLHCGGAHRTSLVSTWPFDVLMLRKENRLSRTYKHQKPTTIGNDVWVADGASILGGVTIGDGAVVGPNAVVFRDVEPYAVMHGNPARLVRRRHPNWVIEALQRIRWWDWGEAVIRERIEDFYGGVEDFVIKYGGPL